MAKFQMTKAEYLRAGKRGNSTQKPQVLVGGRYFTYDALGEVLGVGREEAHRRYANLRRRGIWPITHEHLEGK